MSGLGRYYTGGLSGDQLFLCGGISVAYRGQELQASPRHYRLTGGVISSLGPGHGQGVCCLQSGLSVESPPLGGQQSLEDTSTIGTMPSSAS